jgi:lipopolysaccharide export system permease protein
LPFAVLVGAIAALLMLARKSELAVMRAGGMSVWQFLRPGLSVALLLGIFSITAYNPLAAAARDRAERLYSEAFGRESNVLKSGSAGTWLRQDGEDGQSVINAASASNRGLAEIDNGVHLRCRRPFFRAHRCPRGRAAGLLGAGGRACRGGRPGA